MSGCKEDVATARARPRRKLFQPAELDGPGGVARVHLLDLSETGALVDAAAPPPAGSFVSLACGDLRRSARVAWVKGTRFGARFVMPLTPAEVDATLTLRDRRGA